MNVATALITQGKTVAPESSKLCTQILKILTAGTNKAVAPDKLYSIESIKTVNAVDSTLCSVSNRSISSELPLSTLTSISRCSSIASAADTDSGKSSCGPMVLDESVDSGIMVEFKDLELQKRIQQCQRILKTLERDQETYRRLRERLSKISDRKNRKILAVKQEPFCNVCCAELNLSDPKCFVTCSTCNKAICRNIKCADWLPKPAQWECQLCYTTKTSLSQTSTWVADQMSFNQQKMICPMRARSEIYIPINDFNDSNMQLESASQLGLNSATISAEQKVKIREYVEELVSNILGGSLDKVTVGQLSKSENYMQFFYKYHTKLCYVFMNLEYNLCVRAFNGDLPGLLNGARERIDSNQNDFSDISETRLRKLIATIIAETLSLPMLTSTVSELNLDQRVRLPLTNGNAGSHRKQKYFATETYHELLATAVLNRIAGREDDTQVLSASIPDLSIDAKTKNIDENYNIENQSQTSLSSIEPRSDFSYSDEDQQNIIKETDPKYLLGRESALSDYIASHTVPLPDLSAAYTDDEDHVSTNSSTQGTWEDNWLFKKRHSSLETAALSSGSRMLIPAPKEDIRAQIGDKIADEVSDLSEMGSDTEDTSLDLMNKNNKPLNNRLLNKHLIGGENTKMVLDELIDASLLTAPESKKVELYVQINAEDSDIPTPKLEHTNQNSVQEYPLSGSIAEREYKKWNNAVEMPNNPYAPEALKRRISGCSNDALIDLPTISSSTDENPLAFLKETQSEGVDENTLLLLREQEKLRYSRDYYINNESGAQVLQQSPQKTTPMENQDEPSVDNVIINENSEEELHGTFNSHTDQTIPNKFQAPKPSMQVLDDNSSYSDTHSSPSLQSYLTSTSEDSNTVYIYDFTKQETRAIPSEQSKVMETETSTEEQTTGAAGTAKPTRRSTPMAFKFLQPKRRLIDPSQVLSIDEEAPPPESMVSSYDKSVIEDEVIHVLPSVKALAQAFLLSTNTMPQIQRRWTAKIKSAPATPSAATSPLIPRKITESKSFAEGTAEFAQNIQLNRNASESDVQETASDGASPSSSLYLKSNIAFFENLKFK